MFLSFVHVVQQSNEHALFSCLVFRVMSISQTSHSVEAVTLEPMLTEMLTSMLVLVSEEVSEAVSEEV